MIYIIILVAVFFIIGHLSNDDDNVTSDNVKPKNYSYTTRIEDKYLYLKIDTIPQDIEIIILEILYQGQYVKSYHDLFNDDKGNFVIGSRNNNGHYFITVPINALILPRNKDISVNFEVSLLKNGTIFDKLKSQEDIKIDSRPFLIMEWFIPTIEILAYYSIKKDDTKELRSWSKENIQVIKKVFSKHIDNDKEEQNFLRNKLKILAKNPVSLEESVTNFNNRENTVDDKNIIFYASAHIILNNLESDECSLIKNGLAEIKNLSKLMGISNDIQQDVYSVFEDFSNEHDSTKSSNTLKALSILGLSEGATVDEMRRAYRLKMKDFHPDKYTNLPESVRSVLEEKAQELNLAKEILRF